MAPGPPPTQGLAGRGEPHLNNQSPPSSLSSRPAALSRSIKRSLHEELHRLFSSQESHKQDNSNNQSTNTDRSSIGRNRHSRQGPSGVQTCSTCCTTSSPEYTAFLPQPRDMQIGSSDVCGFDMGTAWSTASSSARAKSPLDMTPAGHGQEQDTLGTAPMDGGN
ncbi:unnamed protein product [Pleuronectes platessa]|uniref:Uncharacterized protein n=1 Tax=Pleuronectes platessa TaxID=8262 RepID=A0A9N7Z1L0_PLEPL|nr:unnamed protein product [Pleuronectes platessa]